MSLLLLSIAFLLSCKNEEEFKSTEKDINIIERKYNDSLVITLQMPPNTRTALSTVDELLFFQTIEFSNTSDFKKKILKKIPKYYETLTFHHLFFYNKDVTNQYYLINKNNDSIKLELNEKYSLKHIHENVDKIYMDYRNISNNIKKKEKKKLKLKEELDSIKFYYNNKFNSKKENYLRQLNMVHYFDKLQMIEPNNREIDSFVKNLQNIHASVEFRSLLINYIRNRINYLDYDKLDKNNKILALANFNFLNLKNSKSKTQYQKARNWLKTTELYKKDSVLIKKEIEPLDNSLFKLNLKQLSFSKTKNEDLSFLDIIGQNSNDYYLIDFWATWCAPCIQGVKTMNRMDLPKNVSVISVSVDKEKDKEKWKNMTRKLEQPITYWLDETKEETKQFMKFIEMQSIPRYILIDKNMNLIDQAFYHPKEPQFLPKLQDVKNHKYW